MADTPIPETGPMSAAELTGKINERFALRFVTVALTQSEYDALSPPDPNTQYLIVT